MTRRLHGTGQVLLLGALCLGALAWHVWADGEEISRFLPRSYSAHVNDFIQRGLLTADCSGERPRVEFHSGRALPADRAWYEASYLRDDLERFNHSPSSSRSFALETGCRLRSISPGLHAIDLPFRPRHPWEGDILWSDDGAGSQLSSSSRTLVLRVPAAAPSETAAETQVGHDGDFEDEAVYVRFGRRLSESAAYIHPVGEAPGGIVVQNNVTTDSGRVRVTGRALPVGRMAYLIPGDWLSFSPARPSVPSEVFLVSDNQGRALASSRVLRNDKAERIAPDLGLGLLPNLVQGDDEPLLAVLSRSIDTALSREPEAVAAAQAGSFDLQLTLSSHLQRQLTASLSRFCNGIESARALRHDFPAGAAVMNGKTGELLALATFPGGGQLASHGAPDLGSRRRLLLNQNLVRHPIGSAGKPFFFAAIAQQYPFLMRLVLHGHGTKDPETYHDLLQCYLPRGYDDHRHAYDVDFRTALEVSCNRYTLHLAALALAANPQAGDGSLAEALSRDPQLHWPLTPGSGPVRFGAEPLSFAPELKYIVEEPLPPGVETSAARECVALRSLDQARFEEPLRQITGVETYGGVAPQASEGVDNRGFAKGYAATRYKTGLWQPLIATMSHGLETEGAPSEIAACFQAISPEEVDLDFNAVRTLRDFVNILLGGSSSSWSNIQLAESLSRLVTSRQVRARLVRGVPPRGQHLAGSVPEVSPAALPLREDVRREVLLGMRQVVMGGRGTARALRPALARLHQQLPDRDLLIFSKTGSPRIEHGLPNEIAPALESLVAGYITYTGDRIAFRDGGPSCCAGRDQAFRAALTDATEKMGFRPKLAAQLYGILRSFYDRRHHLSWDTAYEVSPALSSPLYLLGGRLTINSESPRLRQRLETDDGGVYIFTLVSLPRASAVPSDGVPDPAALAAPEARVITVALHLETGHNNSGLAVAAAGSLLPDLAPLLR